MPLPVPTNTITPVAAEQGASESPEDFVRRLFHKNTYENLSQYRASLQQQIAATDDDVRDVIGSRYKELIETCDMVVGMEDVCGSIKKAYRTQNDATSKQQQHQLIDGNPNSNSTDMEPLWKLLLSERVIKEVGEVVARIEEKVTSLQLFLEACASHSTNQHSPHQFEAAASAYRIIVGVAQRSTIIATCLHALAKEMLPQSQSGEQLSPRGVRGRHKSVAVDAFEGLSVTISRLRGLLSHTLHRTIPNRFYASMRQQLIKAASKGGKSTSSPSWSITSYIDTHVSLSIVLWTSEEAAMNVAGTGATPLFQWSGSSKANPLESHGNAALSKLVELHWIGIQTFIAEKTAGGSRRLTTNTAEVVTRLTDRLSSYLESVHTASVGKQAGTTRISTFIDKSVVEAALGSLGGSAGDVSGSGGQIQRADALLEAAKGAVAVSDEDFLEMMLQYVTEDSNKAVKPSTCSPSSDASNVSSPTGTPNGYFASPTAVAPTLRNHFNLFADVSARSTSTPAAARQGSPDGGRRNVDTRLTITHCVQESLCNYFASVRAAALDASSSVDSVGTLGDGDPSSVRAAYPSVVLGLLRAQDVLLQRYSSAAQVAATTPACILTNGIYVLESLFSAQALLWFGGEKVVLDTSSTNTSIWADVKKEADLFSAYQAVLLEVILGAGRVAEGGKGKRVIVSPSPSTTLPSSITSVFKECVVNTLAALQVEHNSTSSKSAIKGGGVTKWGSWSPSPLKFHPTEEPSGNTPLRASTDLATGFYSTQDVACIIGAISMSRAVPTAMTGFSQYATDVLGSATLLAAFNMNLLASSKRFQRDLGDLVCTALDHTTTTTSTPLTIEKEAVQTEKVVKLLGVLVTPPAPTTVTSATSPLSLYWDHTAWSTTLTTHISTVILGRVQRAVGVIGDEFDGILNYAAACYPHSPYKAHCVASGVSSSMSPTPGATTPTNAIDISQPSFPPTFLAPHYLTSVMPGNNSINDNTAPPPMTNTNLILQSVMARRQAAKKQEVSHASTASRSIAEKDTIVHSDIMLYLMSIRNLLTSLDSHLILTQLQQQQVEIMYDRTKGRLPKNTVTTNVVGPPASAGSPSPRREPTVERPLMSREEEDAVLRQQLVPLYNRVCALSQKIESTFSNLIFKLLDPAAAQWDNSDASARPQLHLHTKIGDFLTALCHRIEDSVERVSKLDEGEEGSPSPADHSTNSAVPSPSTVVLANVAAPILHILLLQLQYSPVLDASARSKSDLQSVRDRKQKAMEALLPFGQHIQHLYVVSYQDWIAFAADKLRLGLRKGWKTGLLNKCATVTHASQRRTKALAELHKSSTTSVPGKPGRIMMDMNGLAQTRFRSTLQSRLWGSENVVNEGVSGGDASDTTQVAFPQRPIPEASLHLLYGLMFDVVHTSTLHRALDVITPVLLGKLRSSVSSVLAEMIDEGIAATDRQLVLDGRQSVSRSAFSSRAVSPASSVGGEVNIDVLRDDCNMTTCEYDECFGCCEEYFVQLSFEAEYLRLCLTPTADLKYRVLSTFKPKSLTADRLIESPRGRSNSGGSDGSCATSHEVPISSRFHSALTSNTSSTSSLATNTARRVAWGSANKAWLSQVRGLVQDIEEQVDVVTWALCESRVSAAASQYFEATKHLIPWCGGAQPTSPSSSKDGSLQLAFRAPVPVSTTLPTIDRFQLLPVTLPVDAATAALSAPSAALQRVTAASPFILTELNISLVEATNDGTGKRGYDMAAEKALQALRGVVVTQPFDTSDEGDVAFYVSPTRDANVAGLPAGGLQALPPRAASQHQSPYNALPPTAATAQQASINSTAAPPGATIASSLKSFWGWQ